MEPESDSELRKAREGFYCVEEHSHYRKSDGIGAAVTKELIARGDRVVGVSRSPSPLGPDGPRHEIQDVAGSGYPHLLTRLVAEEGPFDACIYCAGIGSAPNLPDLSNEAHVVEVNLTAMVRTMAALVPDWLERRAGHFIGLSSLADDAYGVDAPSYSASKAGFSNYLKAGRLGPEAPPGRRERDEYSLRLRRHEDGSSAEKAADDHSNRCRRTCPQLSRTAPDATQRPQDRRSILAGRALAAVAPSLDRVSQARNQ